MTAGVVVAWLVCIAVAFVAGAAWSIRAARKLFARVAEGGAPPSYVEATRRLAPGWTAPGPIGGSLADRMAAALDTIVSGGAAPDPVPGPWARVVVASDEGGQVVATIDDGLVDPLEDPDAADTVRIPRDCLSWESLVELLFRLSDRELSVGFAPEGAGARLQVVGGGDVVAAHNEGPDGLGPALLLPWRSFNLDA